MKQTEKPDFRVWVQTRSNNRIGGFEVVYFGSYVECKEYCLNVETRNFRIERIRNA